MPSLYKRAFSDSPNPYFSACISGLFLIHVNSENLSEGLQWSNLYHLWYLRTRLNICLFSSSKLPIKFATSQLSEIKKKVTCRSITYEVDCAVMLIFFLALLRQLTNGPSHWSKSKWWIVHYHIERLCLHC